MRIILPALFLAASGLPAIAQEALPEMSAPSISETERAEPDWYQQFTFSSNDLEAADFASSAWKGAEAQNFKLSWIKGDRWSLSVDLTSREGDTPLAKEEMSAGAEFRITPRISVGGELSFGTTDREALEFQPEAETEAGIRLRSAFKF